jgi:outer membrane lipoprotein SlyB
VRIPARHAVGRRFIGIHYGWRTEHRAPPDLLEVDMKKHLFGSALVLSMLTLAGCASTSSGGYSGGSGYGSSQASCYECGTVTRIEQGNGSRVPNATGAVIGGIVGAVAGREIAKDHTDSTGRRNTATAAGAVAGAVVGNAIQNRAGMGYNIFVRMSDGRETVVSQDDLNGIREGSNVRIANGRAALR